MLLSTLYAALGAAAGGALRFLVSVQMQRMLPGIFPYGTLTVNVVGSLLLGVLIYYYSEAGMLADEWRLVLAVGFCGGFTTFSTFSLETFNLIKDSEWLLAAGNILLNFVLCLLAVFAAFIISRKLLGGA